MRCNFQQSLKKILPKCLAVPWVAVSNHLDIPPVITHCSYALYNWRYIDPNRPRNMDNLEISVKMTGSWTEDGFVKVPLQVELDFGKGYHVRLWHCVCNKYPNFNWSLADGHISHYFGLYFCMMRCNFQQSLKKLLCATKTGNKHWLDRLLGLYAHFTFFTFLGLAAQLTSIFPTLDIPPVITHCSYALYNWRYIDPNRPRNMDNLEISVKMTGSWTEDGFVKVPLQVELDFGKGYHSIIEGQESVVNGDSTGVLKALMSLGETIVKLKTSFLRIYDVCDPDEFYHSLRPFLAGWYGNPVLPDGLVYEGVSETPLQYSGGSAAESSVFQVLDAALGILHSKDTDGDQFLHRMRYYMPPKHRAFIEAVSNGPSIRNFGEYIMIPANRGKDSKERGMALKGTGGSGIISFLKQVRNETASAISSNNNIDKHSSQDSQKQVNGISNGIH
ncbi:indoleamine 2,3-dioxygenase 2-like [Orbicella faveolata]|uniref:indoleamine 2,3-dioxygenase 2-like n=1 Tax=Orbicella faveolata TaxID=48498 RepID=UPI0009E2313E|nr:indoleamine 2,3-dioxygenase 2-like [Orbicella faveolata]